MQVSQGKLSAGPLFLSGDLEIPFACHSQGVPTVLGLWLPSSMSRVLPLADPFSLDTAPSDHTGTGLLLSRAQMTKLDPLG